MLERQGLLTILLGALSMLVALSVDIYLPAMPGLVKYFHTSMTTVQLGISLFMLGYAVTQLVYGPLSDAYGRRPVLLLSLLIYLVATLICIFADSIKLLNIMRFIQAMGACGSVVLAYAMIRDISSNQETTKAYAYLSVCIGIAPAIAPVLGGQLNYWFGWHSIFIFLLIISLGLLILSSIFLPETNPALRQQKQRQSLHVRQLGQTYRAILQHVRYWPYMIAASASFAAMFTFISTSSFIFVDLIGVSAHVFSYYFAVNALVFMFSAFLTSRLSRFFSNDVLIATGGLLIFIGGMVLLILLLVGPLTSWRVLTGMLIATLGVGLIMPTSMASAMQPFPGQAGMAAALTGFCRFTFSAFVGSLATALLGPSGLSLAGALLLCGLICLVSIILVRKNNDQFISSKTHD